MVTEKDVSKVDKFLVRAPTDPALDRSASFFPCTAGDRYGISCIRMKWLINPFRAGNPAHGATDARSPRARHARAEAVLAKL